AVSSGTQRALAQREPSQQQSTRLKPDSAPRRSAEATGADNDYAKKIKEFTTEPYFMTELVDHLPMSDKVPSPDKVLGYVIGTPNKLTYSKDLYRYYRELALATPRVRVFSAPEKSEARKEQHFAAVGDETLLAALARCQSITAKLADPRKRDDAETQRLTVEDK